jgi:hypothetical protein
MRGAREKPLAQSSTPPTEGLHLVPPREPLRNLAAEERTDQEDSHPFVTVLLLAVVAFTLAFTFFSTILMWVWFRNTGVDWMFSR